MTRLRMDMDVRVTYFAFVCVALVLSMSSDPRPEWIWLAGFLVAHAALEALPMRLPQGASLSVSVGVAIVSLVSLNPLSALAVQAGGQCLAAALADPVPDGRDTLRAILRRTLALGGALLVVENIPVVPGGLVVGSGNVILVLMLAGAVYTVVDLYAFAVLESAIAGASVVQNMTRLLSLVGWVYLSQLSVGVVFVVVQHGLGLLAAPILLLLMLLLQSSFALLLRVRTAYVSTVGALARLAERQSPENAGHAERVASLCAAIGRRMRLPHESLEALSFAATLHDVGYLKVSGTGMPEVFGRGLDPIASEAGASIIEGVDFLAPATRVLRAHATCANGDAVVDTRSVDCMLAAVLESGCIFDHRVRHGGIAPMSDALAVVAESPMVRDFPAIHVALSDLVARGEVRA